MDMPVAARSRSPIGIYVFGAISELLFGYDTGIISVAMLSIKKQIHLTPAVQGLVVSSLLIGAAIGVGLAGRLSDALGRRRVIFLASLVFVISGLGVALAANATMLVLFRFVMGFAVGASAVVVPVYLAELAPTRLRGLIGSLGQLMITSGILLAYVVGYLLQPAGAWRWMFGASVVLAAVVMVSVPLLPETPRFLVLRGRADEARQVLVRLGRAATADTELADIQVTVDHDRSSRLSTVDVVRRMTAPGLRRSAVGALGIALLAQLAGVNSIIYYAPSTLVNAGFGEHAAVAANIGIGAANVLFTFLGMTLVDRMPRRYLLATGSGVMFVAMLGLGATALFASHATASAWLTVVGMILFLVGFGATWGCCVRLIVSELFPAKIRGSAAGLVMVVQWLANALVAQIFPILQKASAPASFLVFAVVSAIAIVFVLRVLPETGSGKSLEDIERGQRVSGKGSVVA